ncbi:MAG: hypothetical protein E6Q84_03355 [Thiothrix sp.]|nr:MAG: hypothetical protein E6Q84_03355 [Thiothrix sp.]
MEKTLIADGFKITIRLFENQASQNSFVEDLKAQGYELAHDEQVKPKTYHLCLDELGVVYYDLT